MQNLPQAPAEEGHLQKACSKANHSETDVRRRLSTGYAFNKSLTKGWNSTTSSQDIPGICGAAFQQAVKEFAQQVPASIARLQRAGANVIRENVAVRRRVTIGDANCVGKHEAHSLSLRQETHSLVGEMPQRRRSMQDGFERSLGQRQKRALETTQQIALEDELESLMTESVVLTGSVNHIYDALDQLVDSTPECKPQKQVSEGKECYMRFAPVPPSCLTPEGKPQSQVSKDKERYVRFAPISPTRSTPEGKPQLQVSGDKEGQMRFSPIPLINSIPEGKPQPQVSEDKEGYMRFSPIPPTLYVWDSEQEFLAALDAAGEEEQTRLDQKAAMSLNVGGA